MKRLTLVIILLAGIMSSCLYRMPGEEDDLHSVPITNNPNVLNKPPQNLMPCH